ncbi:hypothetical protein PR048_002256 [Dryococelus australis]|uniref:Uncharacterized protein n=1 Tax=Dryococelus australis TaxID=614101 RepID=A0ABQ9IJQ0_9NEOP|nr:hypothetical protein PR048_002256 [Dryococelus australis]
MFAASRLSLDVAMSAQQARTGDLSAARCLMTGLDTRTAGIVADTCSVPPRLLLPLCTCSLRRAWTSARLFASPTSSYFPRSAGTTKCSSEETAYEALHLIIQRLKSSILCAALEWAKRGMERRRNEKEGETGDPRENPPTSGIVRHDSHMRKCKSDLTRNRTRLASVGGEWSNHYTTVVRAALEMLGKAVHDKACMDLKYPNNIGICPQDNAPCHRPKLSKIGSSIILESFDDLLPSEVAQWRMLGWVRNKGCRRFLPIPSPIPLPCATCTISNDLAVDETLSPTTYLRSIFDECCVLLVCPPRPCTYRQQGDVGNYQDGMGQHLSTELVKSWKTFQQRIRTGVSREDIYGHASWTSISHVHKHNFLRLFAACLLEMTCSYLNEPIVMKYSDAERPRFADRHLSHVTLKVIQSRKPSRKSLYLIDSRTTRQHMRRSSNIRSSISGNNPEDAQPDVCKTADAMTSAHTTVSDASSLHWRKWCNGNSTNGPMAQAYAVLSRSEGAIRATLTRTSSLSSLLRARRACFRCNAVLCKLDLQRRGGFVGKSSLECPPLEGGKPREFSGRHSHRRDSMSEQHSGPGHLSYTSRSVRMCWQSTIAVAAGCSQTCELRIKVEVKMEQRRNVRAKNVGDPRENPPTSGIVQHDSHVRKSALNSAEIRTRFALEGGNNHLSAADNESIFSRFNNIRRVIATLFSLQNEKGLKICVAVQIYVCFAFGVVNWVKMHEIRGSWHVRTVHPTAVKPAVYSQPENEGCDDGLMTRQPMVETMDGSRTMDSSRRCLLSDATIIGNMMFSFRCTIPSPSHLVNTDEPHCCDTAVKRLGGEGERLNVCDTFLAGRESLESYTKPALGAFVEGRHNTGATHPRSLWSSAGMEEQKKREITEKTCRPAPFRNVRFRQPPAGNRTRLAKKGSEYSDHYTTAAPRKYVGWYATDLGCGRLWVRIPGAYNNENCTARQFIALRVAAKTHVFPVSVSPLSLPRFRDSNV